MLFMLTGASIKEAVRCGDIRLDPYFESKVAQSSVDVHLHPTVLRCVSRTLYLHSDEQEFELVPLVTCVHNGAELHGVWLLPGEFYLGASLEKVFSKKYSIELGGKSGPARKSLKVHFTAGFVESGFHGNITFEMEVSKELFVPIGQPVAQLFFLPMMGEIEDYTLRGNYTGIYADGPNVSRSHRHARVAEEVWRQLDPRTRDR